MDDEQVQREALAEIVRDQGFDVSTAVDVPSAKQLLDLEFFHVILTDYRMPGGTGLDVARIASARSPSTAVFVMTAYADVQGVIDAMRLGALDYLIKPINVEHLLKQLTLLKERNDLRDEIQLLRGEVERRAKEGHWLLGTSKAIADLRDLLAQVALSKGTVLITGESGTGKEVVARQIHGLSEQAKHKFVAINCGAIPEQLLESELFGHKKGAFTGAVADKPGLFTVATGGTLFLDEIGELPKGLQVKLLRAIQEREVTPVGDTIPRKFDTRIIAATNRDLASDVQTGLFRNDLFYRINVIEIKVPPLREHREDIPTLAHHFIQKFSQQAGKPLRTISPDALARLASYPWPGNVRELENVIERAIILARGENKIEICDLPPGFQEAAESENLMDLEYATKEFAKHHILRVLHNCGGDKKDAAKAMGVGLSSLYRKLEELGLSSKRSASEGD